MSLGTLATFAARPLLARLDGLHQRHRGESCYIFGDGISLKWMDLRAFADRPSILGNLSILHREASVLNAAYYAILEPLFFYPVFPLRAEGLKFVRHYFYRDVRTAIRRRRDTTCFVHFSNAPAMWSPNVVYVSRWYQPPSVERNPFRDRTDAFRGTLLFQLSLAVYLGFTTAHLVGHDYTHAPSRALHFYEKGEGVPNPSHDDQFCGDFIRYASQDIDLTTVTLGAGCATMKATSYAELTGRQPKYRENHEIVDREILDSLATWPGYSIF